MFGFGKKSADTHKAGEKLANGYHTFYQGEEQVGALKEAFSAVGAQNVEFKGSFLANVDVETMNSGFARADLVPAQVAQLQSRGITLYPGRSLL